MFLLKKIKTKRINIITPTDRGCQVSLQVEKFNKEIFKNILNNGVVADWREPDVIRIAPVPLYNSFHDIYNFYKILNQIK